MNLRPGLTRRSPFLTNRQLIDALQITASTQGPLEIDPRTIGAPQSVMTSLFEPVAQGRQVLFKKKEDFAKIKIKL